MPRRLGWESPYIFFVVLSLVTAGLAGISWKDDVKTGSSSTNTIWKMGLGGYDLDAGDSIHYEYETSGPCFFIITNDWFNPEVGEKLNISGTQNSGLFECPVAGLYILQVLFLEASDAELASIEYEFYALDDSSRTILMTKPILLTTLTVVLTSMVSVAGLRNRRVNLDEKTRTTQDYWHYFASRISNWIAIVVGASMLVAASIVELVSLTNAVFPGSIRFWLFNIGGYLVVLGWILSLLILWPKYEEYASNNAAKPS